MSSSSLELSKRAIASERTPEDRRARLNVDRDFILKMYNSESARAHRPHASTRSMETSPRPRGGRGARGGMSGGSGAGKTKRERARAIAFVAAALHAITMPLSVLDKICQAFMEKHAVTRVGALLRLRRAQAEAIFVECGAGVGVNSNCTCPWRH